MASQQSESPSQLKYDIDEAVQQEEEEHFTSFFEQDDTEEDLEDDNDINNDNNKKKKTKKKQKWTDVTPVKGNVRVVLDATQKQIWKQAQNEIEYVESMLLNKSGSNKPQLKDLIKLLFGNTKKIFLLFEEDLGWMYTHFCQFIATMAFQSALNLSTKDLYTTSTDRIVTNGLLSEIDYNRAWIQIGFQSKPKHHTHIYIYIHMKFIFPILIVVVVTVLMNVVVAVINASSATTTSSVRSHHYWSYSYSSHQLLSLLILLLL